MDVGSQLKQYLDSNGKADMLSVGKGMQGQARKVQLKDGIVYVAKAYSSSDPMSSFHTFERESTIIKSFVDKCQQYLLCFSGSLVYNNHGVTEYWLITEYLQNYTELFEVLSKGAPVFNTQIYVNMIEGLKILHGLGISHQDIKPENLMVNLETSQVKYLDFGLSCMKDKFACDARGSPMYVAPEIKYVKDIDSAQSADLWSLGMVIWICENRRNPLAIDAMMYFTDKFKRPKTSPYYGKVLNRAEDLDKFVNENNRSNKLTIQRDGYKIDLTKLLNMDPSQRTLQCYEKTRE